jgi:RNA polymerase sigma-70 factor (ECF subfamily)
MSEAEFKAKPEPKDACKFATTRWSLVVAAGQQASPASVQALAALCETYWYPLYAYVRRRGHGPEDAQDLTQAFFTALLEKDVLRTADAARGRFRSFLLTAFKYFLAKEHARAAAQKRGGGRLVLSLDFHTAESQYHREPVSDLTPERIFERRWALSLLDQVLARLEREFADAGKQDLFNSLKVFLTAAPDAGPYSRAAAELGMSEGAIKVAVHRLRQRYRDRLRAEIAQTVANPDEVDDELRQLLVALRSE